jgi:hypothetical protein
MLMMLSQHQQQQQQQNQQKYPQTGLTLIEMIPSHFKVSSSNISDTTQ